MAVTFSDRHGRSILSRGSGKCENVRRQVSRKLRLTEAVNMKRGELLLKSIFCTWNLDREVQFEGDLPYLALSPVAGADLLFIANASKELGVRPPIPLSGSTVFSRIMKMRTVARASNAAGEGNSAGVFIARNHLLGFHFTPQSINPPATVSVPTVTFMSNVVEHAATESITLPLQHYFAVMTGKVLGLNESSSVSSTTTTDSSTQSSGTSSSGAPRVYKL